ncbi:hypothetical protein Tco_0604325 [Tanacetum coccineum]
MSIGSLTRVSGHGKAEHEGIMEMKPDIDNMMLGEYQEYGAEKERQLWNTDVDLEEAEVEDEDDGGYV